MRRLITKPVRGLLRAAGYDVVRLQPAPVPAPPPWPTHGPLADNAILRRIYEEGVVEDAEGRPVSDARMSAVQIRDGFILHDLVRQSGARNTLEVGMAYGASTLFICEALKANGGGHHVMMDPFQTASYNDIGLLNVRRAGFESVTTFYAEESYKVLPRLLAEGREFDFVFIDGDHLFDSVLLDFLYADKMLKPGGQILFHDMDMPSVRKAVSFVLRNKPYVLSLDCHGPVPPMTARLKALLSNMAQTPLEPLIWSYHSLRAPFLTGLVRKLGEDRRLWTHYSSF